MNRTLLPTNERPLQHALAQLNTETTEPLEAGLIRRAKRPQDCPPNMLPWLAWENSISDAEGWLFAENEQAQRDLIAGYIAKHELKGTPAMIRQLFRDMGLGEIDIIENAANIKWDGTADFNGDYYYGDNEKGSWALYAVRVHRPVTNNQARLLRDILAQIAPARCRLIELNYRGTPILWNGEIAFNEEYNFGAA